MRFSKTILPALLGWIFVGPALAVVVSDVDGLYAAVEDANNGGDAEILLQDGTYDLPQMLWISAPDVTVRSQSGDREAVILRGQGMGGGVTHLFNVAGAGFTARDLTLRDVSQHAVQTQLDVDHVTLSNLHILDTGEQMIKIAYDENQPLLTSDYGILEDSLLEYSAGVGPQYYIGGIDAHAAVGWIVRDNVFRYIRSPAGDFAEHAIHFWSFAQDTLAERNLIYNCDRGIGFGLGDRGHIGGIIRNNMVYNDDTEGLADVGIGLESATGTAVYNNTVVLLSGYPNAIEYRWGTTQLSLVANNLTNVAIAARNGATADTVASNLEGVSTSWFADVGNGDLHLAYAVAAAVDQGTAVSALTDDFDGEARPQGAGVDIGADEWPVGGTGSDCSDAGAVTLNGNHYSSGTTACSSGVSIDATNIEVLSGARLELTAPRVRVGPASRVYFGGELRMATP